MSAEPVLLEGTVRSRHPEETWSVLAGVLSRFGITRVARLTGLDYLGIPVHTAIRPASQTLAASQGKGASDLLARISAVMEAVELWFAEQPIRPDHQAPAREVSLPYVLADLAPRLPWDLIDRVPLDWVTGVAIRSSLPVPIPLDLVRRCARRPDWVPDLFRATSNGLAAGNDLDEAALHAMLEVVERDALLTDEVAGGAQRTVIDPASVTDPYCRSLIDRILAANAVLELVWVANSYRVPVCLAYLWTEDYPLFFAGAGCHTNSNIALSRALTEAAQSRLTCIAGTRDDLPGIEPAFDTTPARPSAKEPGVPWDTLAPPASGSTGPLADQVLRLAECVETVTGHEPIRLVLSTPDDPVAAVKVICPGTRSRIRRAIPR